MTVSLRTRLLMGVIVSTTLLLGIFCVIVYVITRNTLTDQFDESLLSTAKMLSAVVESEIEDEHQESDHEGESEHNERRTYHQLELEFDVRMLPEFNNLNGGSYYQFWDQGRTLTVRSPSLGNGNLPFFEDESSSHLYQRCSLPDDKPGRVVSYRFAPRTDEESHEQNSSFIIVVARDASDFYDFMGFFRWLLLNSSIVIVVLSGFVAVKVTRIGLNPVHTLADEIESIDEEVLGQSFTPDAYPVELVPICDRLNSLMKRIKGSFQRERRFNADVAHELRTPLAGIQSTIEVCLTRSREPDEYQNALEDCLAISKTMNRLVSTLLALSQLETQQIDFEPRTIHLKERVEKIWQNFANKAHDKKLGFENMIDDSVVCVTDTDHLSMILSNILENATEYCNEQGRIYVKTLQRDDTVMLILSNTGCNLKPADAEHVFDFFWRADMARTNTGAHCGIGLALVRKVATLLGIKVKVEIEQDSIFSVILELPTKN